MALRRVAWMQAQTGGAAVVDESPGDVNAADVAGPQAGAQLDRHRETAPAAGGSDERDGAVGILEQRGAGAGLADLGHGAAHVDVDQIGAGCGDPLRRGGHHVRI